MRSDFLKRNRLFSTWLLVLSMVFSWLPGQPTVVHAATDESYFTFNSTTGMITGYSATGPKDVIIPATIGGKAVKGIDYSSFSNKALTSVIIPEGVTSIGNYAFSSNALTSVTIPSSVSTIGYNAFYKNQLASVTIQPGVTTIQGYAFQENQLTSVTIPSGVTTIGEKAFHMNQLTSVAIPEGVTSIGPNAFSYNQLASVVIPTTVTTIEPYAFFYNKLTSVTIPEGVTTIGDYSFYDNKLTSLTLPSTVTTIGGYSFLQNQLTHVTFPEGVTSIGEQSFYMNKLTSVTFPSSITSIGKYSFAYNQLTSVTIPDNVTSIEQMTFSNNQLSSVTIPTGVTSIGSKAFENNLLSSITIPTSVTSIESKAFNQNPLAKVAIGNGVTIADTLSLGNNGASFQTFYDAADGANKQAGTYCYDDSATPWGICVEMPTINTQPAEQTVNEGDSSPTLSVAATVSDGGSLGYQWYSNTTNRNTGGTAISNATSATYAAPTTTAGTKYYYVVVTNTLNGRKATATSSVAKVTVNTNAATPIISAQPADKIVNAGDTKPTLSVTATASDGGTLSYQWYSNSTNSNNGGTAITGATNAAYDAPTTTAGITYYYVVVTNTNNNAVGNKTATKTSTVAAVTVNTNAATPNITTEPADQTVNEGDTSPTLRVVATVSDGGTLSYQWYSNTTNSNTDGTPIADATNATYAAPASTAGTTYYYVLVTNTNSTAPGRKTATKKSSAVTVTVNTNAEQPSITTHPKPENKVNASSKGLTLSIVASVSDGGTLSYQWYSNETNSNTGGTPVADATDATYVAPTKKAGTTYYYVVVTNTNNHVPGHKTATATSDPSIVKVTPSTPYYPVTGVELDHDSLTFLPDEAPQRLQATVLPDYASIKQVNWTSSKPQAASVNANGEVTPLAPGTTVITVTTVDGNYIATSLVTVKEPEAEKVLDHLEVSERNLYMQPKEERKLSVYAVYQDGNREDVTTDDETVYTSSNTRRVKVSEGTVTAYSSLGVATITIAYQGQSIRIPVKITSIGVETLTITEGDSSLELGESLQLHATAQMTNGNSEDVTEKATWHTEDHELIELGENGEVTAKAGGTATVTVVYGGKEAQIQLDVIDRGDVKRIVPNKRKITLAAAQEQQITLKAYYEDRSKQIVTEMAEWTSSDEAIVTVQDGLLTAGAPGTASITVTFAGKSTVLTVTVTE